MTVDTGPHWGRSWGEVFLPACSFSKDLLVWIVSLVTQYESEISSSSNVVIPPLQLALFIPKFLPLMFDHQNIHMFMSFSVQNLYSKWRFAMNMDIIDGHKALIRWFLVSHQVLLLHTMRVGRYYHYSANRYFSRKKLTNVMARWSSLIIRYCRRVLLDAVH